MVKSKSHTKNCLLLIFLLSMILPAGCQDRTGYTKSLPNPNWKYADLRLMDPIDASPNSIDLIAVYTRQLNKEFQIRLDFLDLIPDDDFTIILALDTRLGGKHQLPIGYPTDLPWDLMIEIPSSGALTAQDDAGNPISNLKLTVVQNQIQDFVTISVSSSSVHKNTLAIDFQVFIAQNSQRKITDKSYVVSEYAYPPEPAKLLLSFWNIFNPTSPATSLRSWDGAHSGKNRDRNGLKYLIEASLDSQIPVSLLDLKSPENLSVLDYLDGLPLLRTAVDANLITLPDVMPINFPDTGTTYLDVKTVNWINDFTIQTTQNASRNFNLPLSSILTVRSNLIPQETNYRLIVILPKENESGCVQDDFFRYRSKMILAIRMEPYPSCNTQNLDATSGGPSIDLKRRIVNSYFSGNPFVMIGGDFLDSSWGNPSAVRKTMHYFSSHPWIYPMDITDLLQEAYQNTLNPLTKNGNLFSMNGKNAPGSMSDYLFMLDLDTSLQNMDPGPIKNLFWDSYHTILNQPSEARFELAKKYLGQLGLFLPAYSWYENPTSQSECTFDLDQDGHLECILSNQEYFLIIDGDGGIISLALALHAGKVHQLVGPTYQLAIGISDPMDWDLTQGIYSDPGQIVGGLQIKGEPGVIFQMESFPDNVTLRNSKRNLTKWISLEDGAIKIKVTTHEVVTLQIPLLLDPWIRYLPGWQSNFHLDTHDHGILFWGSPEDIGITMKSSEKFTFESFNRTRQAALLPEDPNFDYGLGHYLPFPLALAEFTTSDQVNIELRLSEDYP